MGCGGEPERRKRPDQNRRAIAFGVFLCYNDAICFREEERQMKKQYLSLLLAAALTVCCALGLSACENAKASGPSQRSEAEQTTKPSGFADGNVQREYVFVNNQLFVYDDDYQETLPSDLELLGTVQQSDGTKLPDSELAAANVSVGASVYGPKGASGDYLYVQISDTRYERFVLSN